MKQTTKRRSMSAPRLIRTNINTWDGAFNQFCAAAGARDYRREADFRSNLPRKMIEKSNYETETCTWSKYIFKSFK